MFVCVKPKFEKPMTEETAGKLRLSHSETEEMGFRPVYCPYCALHVIDLFEDSSGHLAFKCPRCKGTVLINAAYFHRSRRHDPGTRRRRGGAPYKGRAKQNNADFS